VVSGVLKSPWQSNQTMLVCAGNRPDKDANRREAVAREHERERPMATAWRTRSASSRIKVKVPPISVGKGAPFQYAQLLTFPVQRNQPRPSRSFFRPPPHACIMKPRVVRNKDALNVHKLLIGPVHPSVCFSNHSVIVSR